MNNKNSSQNRSQLSKKKDKEKSADTKKKLESSSKPPKETGDPKSISKADLSKSSKELPAKIKPQLEPKIIKQALKSTPGNIVFSWEQISGSWGFGSYPSWDYQLSDFKEEYLLDIIDKIEVILF